MAFNTKDDNDHNDDFTCVCDELVARCGKYPQLYISAAFLVLS